MVGHSLMSVESRYLRKAGDAVISDLIQNINEAGLIAFGLIAQNDYAWVLEILLNAWSRSTSTIW